MRPFHSMLEANRDMAKIKRLPELMSEVKQEYDKDPTNWRILRGKDKENHLVTFIAHADKELWQLKTEWKTPVRPIGIGKCVKRKLDDEIQGLLNKGTNLPIHEIYPNKENSIIALGFGKYSQDSTDQLKELLKQDISNYTSNIENKLNLEFKQLLKKEQLLNHYL